MSTNPPVKRTFFRLIQSVRIYSYKDGWQFFAVIGEYHPQYPLSLWERAQGEGKPFPGADPLGGFLNAWGKEIIIHRF